VDEIIDAIASNNHRRLSLENRESEADAGVYSYYNLEDIVGKSGKLGNNWAGASHWKKGSKPSGPSAPKEGGATTKTKKAQKFIDFTRSVMTDTFAKAAVPKSSRSKRKDPYKMTDAAITKQNLSSNLLPHDSGVGVAQLSRLFLRPNATVKGVHSGGKGGAPKPAGNMGGEGVGNFADVTMDNDMVFDDGPDFDCGTAEDGNFMDSDNYVVKMNGVRKVEKVDVGYATTAKNVDVKRLKKDLWEELQSHKSVNPQASSPTSAAVSFSGTVDKLEAAQRQDDVSTAYYFICLLHLANEKGLKIEGQENLRDMWVVKDEHDDPTFGNFGKK